MIHVMPPAEYLTEPSEILSRLVECSSGGFLVVDTETTGLSYNESRIVLWTFGDKKHRCAAKEYHLDVLKEFLAAHKDVVLLFHNADFDIHMLYNSGFDKDDLWRRSICTMVLSNLWDPDGDHSLKGICWNELGIPPGRYKEFDFSKKDIRTLGEEDFSQLIDYATKDAWLTAILFNFLFDRLPEMPTGKKIQEKYRIYSLWDYYVKIERPTSPILWEMERAGIKIDTSYLEDARIPIEEILERSVREICDQLGYPINVRSNQQLAKALYEDKGYKILKRTDKGAPSTKAEVITKLLDSNPGDPLLLAIKTHATVEKIRSTYIDGMLAKIENGRLHTSFNQAVTATGRLSSSNPNLQNIPNKAKDTYKVMIRRAFIPNDGHLFIVADYGQVEVRILAHIAEAYTLIDPINEGKDVHALTASRIFRVSYEDIIKAKKAQVASPEQEAILVQRTIAKTLNFGVLYGMSAYGFIRNLKEKAGMIIDKPEAKEYLRLYWEAHHDLREYFDRCVANCQRNGFVETLLGRRRNIAWPSDKRENWIAYNEAVNQTYNAPIQGTASEIVKLAMAKLREDKKLVGLGACMLLQVHDELVVTVPKENAEEARELVVFNMENPGIELRVPLLVDANIASNWYEGK